MNAIQPSRPPLQQPIERRRVAPRQKRHLRQRSHRVMALETAAKIAVNLVISYAAIAALTKLLPHHWSQQEKLREIRIQVEQMEERVSSLQTEFSRNFDPRQQNQIIYEQTARREPNQRPIVLKNSDPKELQDPH